MVDGAITNEDLQRRLAAAEDRALTAEAAQREGDARHQLLMKSLAQSTWETNAVGVVVVDSPSWRAYTGQTREQWLGYGWLDAIHPDDRAYAERQWRQAMQTCSPVDAEFRLRSPDRGWRWTNVRAAPMLDATGIIVKWLGVNIDIEDRKHAEAALRDSEERQAFLLLLSDALRPLADASTITGTATRLLGEHLGVNRVYYAEWPKGTDYAEVRPDYQRDGASSLAGRYPVETFRSAYDKIAEGKTWIVEDNATAPGIGPAERAYHQNNGVIAWIDVPLTKEGRPVAVLCVVQDQPRQWTRAQIALCEEAAERCWAAIERGRAEAALRASEARFQQFADASSGALWIRNASTLNLEYVSPAIVDIYGVDPETFFDGVEVWAAAVVPEDRDAALRRLEEARQGNAVVHEFRIQRADDHTFRWIRNTDFPLYDNLGRVERIGGIAEDVTETKLAVEHQGVLLHELQHRVRNIMGIIRSIGNRSADGAIAVEDYRKTLEGRMLALARVQALLTREANAGGSLRDIIESEVTIQAHHQHQFELVGPDIMLAPKATEVLTLAFHELSTNALKYGAFSVPEGHLRVSWALSEQRGEQWLGIDWTEGGVKAQPPSERRGFGSELIEARIPYELGGTGKVDIAPGGARCHIEFPLRNSPSILETDSPLPTTTFGGTIDMTGAPDLTGRTILVVEDDYFLASDTAAALRGAGASIVGPCASEDAAVSLLEVESPSHAVLDLNLGGGGPRFEIAKLLQQKGVPFVFLTGYDPDVIPPELLGVPRLQKPVPFRSIVDALSQL